jgi:membrane associated rhomboid family serine protease
VPARKIAGLQQQSPGRSGPVRSGIVAVMLIHNPDPTYTRSERSHANFRLAIKLAVAFVGVVWLMQLTNWAMGLGAADLGVRPRDSAGLAGIVFAPLLHADFEHLLANTPPLLVLLTMMLYLYPNSALKVLPAVYFGSGIAVWLFARGGVHIGASGLIYGLVGYVLVAGIIRRDRRAIAASLIVSFLYGALVWGVLPIRYGMSWETHLAAAVIGVAMAVLLRRLDVAPRARYTWEEEPEEHDQQSASDEDRRERI